MRTASPITPSRPGAPSRVIQGYFPAGRPRITQAAASVAQRRPGAIAAGPAAVQPTVRPGVSPGTHQSILPAPVRSGAIGPLASASQPKPQPILPNAPRPAAVQPSSTNAFALPPGFALGPSGLGQPLPETVQRKMEAFFGASFADVRVHVGPEASSIGALAFTHGTDLYFAPGQYNPQSSHGQQLLGHELTHVIQQRAGRVRNPLGSGVAVVQDAALEAEAERMGRRAASAPEAGSNRTPYAATTGGPPNLRSGGGSATTSGSILPSVTTANDVLARAHSGTIRSILRAQSVIPAKTALLHGAIAKVGPIYRSNVVQLLLNAKMKKALDNIKTTVTDAASAEARWTLIKQCLDASNSGTDTNVKDGAKYLGVAATKPAATTAIVEKVEPDDITSKYNVAYACVLQTAIYIKGSVWEQKSPKALHELIWTDNQKAAYRQYDDSKVTPKFFVAIGMTKVAIPTGTKLKDLMPTYLQNDRKYAVSVTGSVEDHSLVLDNGQWKEYNQTGSGSGFKAARVDTNAEVMYVYA
jgi:hypothetical protein